MRKYLILIIAGLLLIALGTFFYFLNLNSLKIPNFFSKPEFNNSVLCAQDVKQCPDGSYVSRQGPKCEFAPCPSQFQKKK